MKKYLRPILPLFLILALLGSWMFLKSVSVHTHKPAVVGVTRSSPSKDKNKKSRRNQGTPSLVEFLLDKAAEHGAFRTGTKNKVQVPRLGNSQTFDDVGQRVARPGEKTLEGTEQTLYRGEDFEIRETVVSKGTMPFRLLEKIKHPGTPQQKVVRREEMAPHRIIARLKEPGKATLSLIGKLGFKIDRPLRGNSTVLVTVPEGKMVEQVIAALRSSSAVAYAEPDWIVHATDPVIPNDPDFSQLWGLNNSGQTTGTPDADIDAPEAWSIGTGSHDIVVAVIDSGIDYTHPDLASNMWVNEAEANGEPQVDDDGNGYVDDVYGSRFQNGPSYWLDCKDDNYHGTHCAGIVGASGNNSNGVSGVCWNVRLMAVKFLTYEGIGYTSDAILGIDYARENGAHVMSNSWGGGGFSQALEDAVQAASDAGIPFIAAAGNDGTDNDVEAHYPSNCAAPNVISVAATDHNDRLAWFSNFGVGSVDLAAPGVRIYSTMPTTDTGWMYPRVPFYDFADGTSMATPFVSGAAALLLAQDPTLTPTEIKQRLMARADPVPGLIGKIASGGRLNLFNALRDDWQPEAPAIQVSRFTYPNITPGSTGLFSLRFTNVGASDAPGVTATLETTDPYVTIVSGVLALGDLAAHTHLEITDAFTVQISSELTTERRVDCTVVARDTDGRETRSACHFHVFLPDLQAHQELDFEPGDMLADPVRNRIYVVDRTRHRVVAVSMDLGRSVAQSFLPEQVLGMGQMTVSLDGSRLYVVMGGAGGARKIQVLSLPELEPLNTIVLDFDPDEIAYVAGGVLCVSSADPAEAWTSFQGIDASSGATLWQTLKKFRRAGVIFRVSRDGTRLFVGETGVLVAGGPGNILEYDVTGSGEPVLIRKHPFTSMFLLDLRIDEDHGRVYTACSSAYLPGVQVTDMVTHEYDRLYDLPDAQSPASIGYFPGAPAIFAGSTFFSTSGTSADVRKFLTEDGRPLGDLMLLETEEESVATDMSAGRLVMSRDHKVLGIREYAHDLDRDKNAYWAGIIGHGEIGLIPIAAGIEVSTDTGEAPLSVHFDAGTSTVVAGSIVTFQWDFGDGTQATGQEVDHTYTANGVYTATLTVTDNFGFSDSSKVNILCVDPVPVLQINFQDSFPYDPPEGWVADFGDAFDSQSGFGWINGTDEKVTAHHNSTSEWPLINKTYHTIFADQEAVWECALPNGDYAVTVNCGFPDAQFKHHVVEAEGVLALNVIKKVRAKFHTTSTVQVRVRDGRLTVVAGSTVSSATCINWLTVHSIPRQNKPPFAKITAKPLVCTAPKEVRFDATASHDIDGVIASYAWNFGDGQSATGAQPRHIYSSPGIFTATLTVTDDLGASDSTEVEVNTFGDPLARINFTHLESATKKGWLPFTGGTFNNTVGFGWSEGEALITQSYDSINDPNLDIIERTYHRIGKGQSALFEYALPNGEYYVTVCSGNPDFGVGHHFVAVEGQTVVDSVQVEKAVFVRASIRVQIEDGRLSVRFGDAAMTERGYLNWLAIYRVLPPNQAPIADINVTNAKGEAPLETVFDAGGSSDADDEITAYQWDFGDGTFGTGMQVTHTYSAQGIHTATLTVTDEFGATNVASVRIICHGETVVRVNFQDTYYTSPAGWDPDYGEAHEATRGFGWVMATETNVSPSHVFQADPDILRHTSHRIDSGKTALWELDVPNGDYLVGLTCGDSNYGGQHHYGVVEGVLVLDVRETERGVFYSEEVEVRVRDGRLTLQFGNEHTEVSGRLNFLELYRITPERSAPWAVATATPAAGSPPLDVVFDGAASHDSDGTIVSWHWDFGDGNTSDEAVTGHTYLARGTFSATLKVTDDDGLSDTVSVEVNTLGQPIAKINFQDSNYDPPLGWTPDFGTAFDLTTGFGWIGGTEGDVLPGSSRDMTLNTRDRTYMHQYMRRTAFWEYVVPNGEYLVRVCSGDPDYGNRQHHVRVEGLVVIDVLQDVPGEFTSRTALIAVEDGRLTVQYGHADTTKYGRLNWLEIYALTKANQAPTANSQAIETNEDLPVPFALGASDPEQDPLTFIVVDPPDHGTLAGTAPNLTYTPNPQFFGQDSFTFKANDGHAESNIASISITVHPSNDPRYTLTVINGSGNGDYLAGAVVNIAADEPTSGKTFDRWTGDTAGIADLNAPSTTLTMPADSVALTATFKDLPNQNPELSSKITADPNPCLLGETVAFTGAATDPDGDLLIYTWTFGDGDGGTGPSVSHSYSAAGDYTVQLVVSDGNGGSVSDVLVVTVAPSPNETPIADSQNLNTQEDNVLAVLLTASDADGDPLSYQVVNDPANGTLTGTAPNLTYTPSANFNGSDNFTFKSNDGTVDSNIATISITVSAINDAPTASSQDLATTEDIALPVTLSANDVDGDALSYLIVSGPINGSLTGTAPILTYTPNVNFNGSDSFTFKANDGTQDSNIATTSINVNPSTDPLFNLTVNSGSGDGNYTVGAVVNISADVAPTGKTFDSWTGDVSGIADVHAANTTMTMPSANQTITATYKAVPADPSSDPGSPPTEYTLTVHNGNGSGIYSAGTMVSISAPPPALGQAFDGWTGDVTQLADPSATSTTLTMPATDLSVTATYKSIARRMSITKAQFKLNFKQAGRDLCKVQGTLDPPEGFDSSGVIVELDIGGVRLSFTLDSKGKSRSAAGLLMLKERRGVWSFKMVLKRGSWSDEWEDEGLVNDTVNGIPITIPVVLIANDDIFMGQAAVTYKAKAGKSGKAR